MPTLRNKSSDEQLEEAERYTSEAEAMKKHSLEQTGYDHLVRCGTPPDTRMFDRPDVALIDLMDDEEVEARIKKDLSYAVMGNYTMDCLKLDIQFQISNEGFKSLITETLMFLSKVGRLPKEYRHLLEDGE